MNVPRLSVQRHVECEVLNEAQLAALLNLSQRSVGNLRKQPWFPKPMVLGPRILRWNRREVLEAIQARAPRTRELPEPDSLKSCAKRTAKQAATTPA